MPTIVHYDVASEEPERAKKFSASLFGWKFRSVTEFQYNLIDTADRDGTPGVRGGLGKRMDPSQWITNYFGVTSIDAAMKQVADPGGNVVTSKMPVPGMGYLANVSIPGGMLSVFGRRTLRRIERQGMTMRGNTTTDLPAGPVMVL